MFVTIIKKLAYRLYRCVKCETPFIVFVLMVCTISWSIYQVKMVFGGKMGQALLQELHENQAHVQMRPNKLGIFESYFYTTNRPVKGPQAEPEYEYFDSSAEASYGQKSDQNEHRYIEEAFAKLHPGEIPVAVVEEHHDVVNWWFQAAVSNIIPRTGDLTLLHIDAHSDMVMASLNDQYPLFRFPKKKELKYLRQSNDRFIMASVLTGLFNRVVFVAPMWILQQNSGPEMVDANILKDTGYRSWNIFTGLVTDPEGLPQPDFLRLCVCYVLRASDALVLQKVLLGSAREHQQTDRTVDGMKRMFAKLVLTLAGSDSVETACFRFENESADNTLWPFSEMVDKMLCEPRVHTLVEFVSDDVARSFITKDPIHVKNGDRNAPSVSKFDVLPYLPGSTQGAEIVRIYVPPQRQGRHIPWFGPQENVLLDIDEDFFGVQLSVTLLEAVKIGKHGTSPSNLSDLISRVFCASNASEEFSVNELFRRFLKAVYDVRDQWCADRRYKCKKQISPSLLAKELTDAVGKTWSSLLLNCQTTDTQRDLEKLVDQLMNYNGTQLAVLSKVGICLERSPNTLGIRPVQWMQLCASKNIRSLIHVPGQFEHWVIGTNLQTIFTRGNFTPKAVTICRSVRYGYTLRERQQRIEEDILTALQDAFKDKVTDNSIFYDYESDK